MSTALASAPNAATLVPEDEEANVFVLGQIYVRCSHDSHDPASRWLKRTVGGGAIPDAFHVVSKCRAKGGWRTTLDTIDNLTGDDRRTIPTVNIWEVTPDTIEILAPPGQPVAVDGVTLDPVPPDLDDPQADGRLPGSALYRFVASVPVWEDVPDILSPGALQDLLRPKEYEVRVGTAAPLTVYAHRGHQVKLKVKLPSVKSIKTSNKAEIMGGRVGDAFTRAGDAARAGRPVYQRGRPVPLAERAAHVAASGDVAQERTRTRTTWTPRTPGFLVTEKKAALRGGDPSSRTTETGTGSQPETAVTLTVDGVDIGRRYTEIAEQVQKVGLLAEGIMDLLASFRFGWYVDVDYDFGQGSVAFAWGQREHTDHRAFLGVGLDLDIVLFAGRFEAGFGVRIGGGRILGNDDRPLFDAAAFFYFEGEVAFKVAVERDAPEIEAGVETKLEAAAKGGIGVRAVAPGGAQAELTGETGIEVRDGELVFERDGGAHVEGEVWWLGFETTVKVTRRARARGGSKRSAEEGGSREAKKGTFGWKVPQIPPRRLGDFSIPAYKYEKDLTPPQIVHVFHNEFESRWFELFEYDIEAEGPDGRIGPLEIAERVTRALLRHPDVPRDRATVETVAERCRAALEPYMSGYLDLNPEIPRSEFTKLLEFIHSDEPRTPAGGVTLSGILAEAVAARPSAPAAPISTP